MSSLATNPVAAEVGRHVLRKPHRPDIVVTRNREWIVPRGLVAFHVLNQLDEGQGVRWIWIR